MIDTVGGAGARRRPCARRPARALRVCAVAALCQASGAIDAAASDTPAQPVVLAPRVGVPGGPAPISLEEAIRLALEHNTDVAIARLQREATAEDVRAAEGVYDLRLLPLFNYQRTVTPSTSALSGGQNGRVEDRRVGGDFRIEGRNPFAGGQFTVDFAATRTESSNNFLRLNPQIPSSFGVNYVQPLFRNLRIDAERRQILLSRRASDLSDVQLTRVLMDQLSVVEQAYWDLVFARRNLDVLATGLAQARAQVASNERQVREGTLAPIDVVEAQTQVATFEENVATAQQMLTEAENRLKRLVLANRQASMWNQALEPADAVDRPVPQLTVDEAVKLALSQRPELRELDVAVQQNDIDRRFFADQARPQADLVASYTLSGLAGTAITTGGGTINTGTNPAVLSRLNELSVLAGFDQLVLPPTTAAPLPSFLVGGLNESLANIWNRRFPVAQVQVQVELPIRNRTARANVARADIARRQLDEQREQLQQTIESEVRNALQAVQSAGDRLRSAASAQRSALEQYESEQRRFESGLSTVFLVLQRQTTLVTAQAREVRARADLNQAIAIFDRAIGATLTQHGVQLQGAAE
jgi:HAE1 family hydrophobic/amphiphilic exporter-1